MKPIYKTIRFHNHNLVMADFMFFPASIGLGFNIGIEEYQWDYHSTEKVTVIRFNLTILGASMSINIPCSLPPKDEKERKLK